jgi:hypothetical protein
MVAINLLQTAACFARLNRDKQFASHCVPESSKRVRLSFGAKLNPTAILQVINHFGFLLTGC